MMWNRQPTGLRKDACMADLSQLNVSAHGSSGRAP